MDVIKYNPKMKITNTDQLPRGTGCKYLEVLKPHVNGEYIAVQWRRKLNTTRNSMFLLIEFGK